MNNPNHGIFSQYWDTFFQFLKKGQGEITPKPPPPPTTTTPVLFFSYPPVLTKNELHR